MWHARGEINAQSSAFGEGTRRKGPFGRQKLRWEKNIRIDVREIELNSVAQRSKRERVVTKTVTKFRV